MATFSVYARLSSGDWTFLPYSFEGNARLCFRGLSGASTDGRKPPHAVLFRDSEIVAESV